MSTVVVGLVHSAAAEIEAELWSCFPLQGLREQIPVAKRETWIERQSTVWRVGLVLELPALDRSAACAIVEILVEQQH